MQTRTIDAMKLSVGIVNALKMGFVETMFYRFEFARGGLSDFDCSCAFCGDGQRPTLFWRIQTRKAFLLDGKAPTYLEDLKADLKDAGKRRSEAERCLREYVETNLCPLTNSIRVVDGKYQEPFFPSARTIGNRTQEYCYKLFELQDFLLRDIGVKPGSLLPVWIIEEPKDNSVLPVFGMMPVKKSLIEPLLAYLIWSYDGWLTERRDRLPQESAVKERRQRIVGKRTKTGPHLLEDALRWGRIFIHRHIMTEDMEQEMEFKYEQLVGKKRGRKPKDQEDKPIARPKRAIVRPKRTEIHKIWDSRSERMQKELPRYVTEEIVKEWKRTGEKKDSSLPLISLVKYPGILQQIEAASEYGQYLYLGEYKHLW